MREMLEEVLQYAKDLGASFADLRLTEGTGTGVSVQDGIADRVSTASSRGAGVRVLVDGAWGFAPTNNPTREELRGCVEDAVSMARAASPNVTDPGMVADFEPVEAHDKADFKVDPREIPLQDRVSAIYELEKLAREQDPRIVNTVANYRDSAGSEIIANSEGTYIEGSSVRCGLNVHVTAQEGDVRQTASKNRSNSTGYELIQSIDPEDFAAKTARKAVEMLSAKRAPAGKFDVVIDSIICGLLVHEAFGHNSEADAVWTGNSILAGKLGQQVAAESVTIIDDPTLPGLNGSFEYDHEGVPARRHVIVDRGVLVGYLHSLETAARMGMEPNGAARAQGHQDVPIVRMSNTAIEPGDCGFDEMLAEVGDGLYLSGGAWGYVYTAAGQFTCNVEQAFRIERG